LGSSAPLREVVADVAVVDLVRRFMDRPVAGERTVRAERGLGLYQGSPLSPMLCNLYLDAFDRAMPALGYQAIRYSDDIAIAVADRGSAERALADAARELAELRLDLDLVKSQMVSFDDGVAFLGATITSVTSPGAPTAEPAQPPRLARLRPGKGLPAHDPRRAVRVA
jgi:CRISPR-associated protein Cas1